MSDRPGHEDPVGLDPHVALLDDAQTQLVVAERASRRLITEADDLDATLGATLRSIAATGGTVLVDTTVGRRVRGRVGAVASSFLVLAAAATTSYVRIDQVTAVRAPSGTPTVRATPDDGGGRRRATPLVDVLGDLASQRTPVDVHLVGGSVERGTLRRVGTDVLTLRADHGDQEVLVNLSLVAVITVPRGGG